MSSANLLPLPVLLPLLGAALTLVARRHRRTQVAISLGVLAASLAVAVTLPLAGTASADHRDVPGTLGARTLTNTPEPTRPAFYEPPATIPSASGTVIRSEPASSPSFASPPPFLLERSSSS